MRLDIGAKLLLHKPSRVWRFFLATIHILRRRFVQYDWLAIWLGHACCISALAPGLLSICQEIYPFVARRRGGRGRIPRRIATEMQDMANLSFLSGVALDAKYGPEIYCGDSSGFAWGIVTSPSDDAEQRALGRYRERWRFRHCEEAPSAQYTPDGLCLFEGQPSPLGGLDGAAVRAEGVFLPRAHVGTPAATRRARGFGARPSRQHTRSVPVEARQRDRRIVYRPEGVPSLPDSIVDEKRWRLAIQQRWTFHEHINVLELRVAVSALRRAARDSRFFGRRLLVLSDNMVAVLLLEKGRSRVRGLNALCRKAAAYLLATGMHLRVRYLETDRNPADGPSRMQAIGWHPGMASQSNGGSGAQGGPADWPCSHTAAQPIIPRRKISLFDALCPRRELRLAEVLPVPIRLAELLGPPGLSLVFDMSRAPPGLSPTLVAAEEEVSCCSNRSSFKSCDSEPVSATSESLVRREESLGVTEVEDRAPSSRGRGRPAVPRTCPRAGRRLSARPGGFAPERARVAKHLEDLNSIDHELAHF